MPKPVLHKVLFFTSVSTSVKEKRERYREREEEREQQSLVLFFFFNGICFQVHKHGVTMFEFYLIC